MRWFRRASRFQMSMSSGRALIDPGHARGEHALQLPDDQGEADGQGWGGRRDHGPFVTAAGWPGKGKFS